MNYNFSTVTELEKALTEYKLSIPDFMIAREMFLSGKSKEDIVSDIDRRIAVTKNALELGLREKQVSQSGMTNGSAIKLKDFTKNIIQDDFYTKAIMYSIAINEVNASGGRIVAFPTAGSSGIVPGTLWAFKNSRKKVEDCTEENFRGSFLVASAIGIMIAAHATLSGAEGGCQAECGAAGAMVAGALVYLCDGTFAEIFTASALSLKNSLGLACDPVAGLVEVPCVKRNGFLASHAITAANLALAGIESVIPFDQVILAMKEIGDSMPESIKESALGGLAISAEGCKYTKKLCSCK